MQINLRNSGPFEKFVVITDDNQNGLQVFGGSIADDQTIGGIQIVPSSAGYGDIHYRISNGPAIGNKLLKDGDTITV
jgi:hypothetical protein